ncbi:MAG: nucleotidyltransferase family protein [Gammaproteobacteria bacterium]|nr:MAG: nucleotidyltransferase family protein [Gammaproteobacteria bacterium]
MTTEHFTAIILAADRNAHDPLLEASGVCCKALIKIAGTPMLQRVVTALLSSERVETILLSGPVREYLANSEFLENALNKEQIGWRAAGDSPSSSAWQLMQDLADETPVLLTTADHPLLTAGIVDHFLDGALRSGADLAVGIVTFPAVQDKFPKAKKTVTRFRDGDFCGCNLFAFLTPKSRRVAKVWREVEQQRKNPLRIIGQLGWWSVLRYLLGRLTLDQALTKLSERLDVNIRPVHLPFPEAAIDVDSIADQQLVEEITGIDN